jgi:hypothetical protein
MNAKMLLTTSFVAAALPIFADEAQVEFDASAPAKATTEWKYNPALWTELFTEKREAPTMSIGRSDIAVSGPLVETFRRPRYSSTDRSLGQRILSLPIINLFVPQPMPSPPSSGGRYFAWGRSSRPWRAIAEGAPAGAGGIENAINHEPSSGLINLSW